MGFKKSFVSKFLTVLALTGMVSGSLGQSAVLAAEQAKIPSGTTLLLKAVTKITPKEYRVGDKVRLLVIADVEVDGVVVIKSGAGAIGEVILANKKAMAGIPARIGIRVCTVEAVDGTEVSLTGNKVVEGQSNTANVVVCAVLCTPLALLFSGGGAEISANDTIEATILSNTKIEILK